MTSSTPLIRAKWTGEAFLPVNSGGKAWCAERLGRGELVTFDFERDRSMKSHRAQFAEIRNAFASLPEYLSEAPFAQSEETLRKHALILTGWVDAQVIEAGSVAAAERIAAMMRTDGMRAYGYCIVSVRGQIVTRYTAKSQSVRTMGREDFQKSKTDVLNWLAKLLEVNPSDLDGEAA